MSNTPRPGRGRHADDELRDRPGEHDPRPAEQVAASLMALADRPSDRQVEQANQVLRSIEPDLT